MRNSRKIINVVKYYKEFNKKDFLENDIGLEIQDFTDSNLKDKEVNNIINFYKKEFKNLNCIKSMHGPFIDLKPSSPDLDIQKLSRDKYIKALKIASELNMDYIIYHSQLNSEHINPAMKEFTFNNNYSLWRKLLKAVPSFNGKILIENIFEEEPYILKELIEYIDLENIKINLDIGHAKLSKTPIEKWIKVLGKDIEYMHIHSNNGVYDQHLAPTREEIKNIYTLLSDNNINPVLSLEYSKKNLKKELKKYKRSAN